MTLIHSFIHSFILRLSLLPLPSIHKIMFRPAVVLRGFPFLVRDTKESSSDWDWIGPGPRKYDPSVESEKFSIVYNKVDRTLSLSSSIVNFLPVRMEIPQRMRMTFGSSAFGAQKAKTDSRLAHTQKAGQAPQQQQQHQPAAAAPTASTRI